MYSRRSHSTGASGSLPEKDFKGLDAAVFFILSALRFPRGGTRATWRSVYVGATALRHGGPVHLTPLTVLRLPHCERMHFLIVQRHLSLNRSNLCSQGFTLGLDFHLPAARVFAPLRLLRARLGFLRQPRRTDQYAVRAQVYIQ